MPIIKLLTVDALNNNRKQLEQKMIVAINQLIKQFGKDNDGYYPDSIKVNKIDSPTSDGKREAPYFMVQIGISLEKGSDYN